MIKNLLSIIKPGKLLLLGFITSVSVFTSCTTSRNIIASGKVTPKGAFKVGFNSAFNASTAPIGELDDITKAAVRAVSNKDSVYVDEIQTLTRGLVAYSLDPVSPTTDFYLRYGLAERVDVGYKLASGTHVFDAMYQFMGSTGTPDNPGANAGGLYGSIGIQYSGKRSNLPSKLGLDKLSPIFTYDLNRKDILVPLVFSQSFGPEEEYGNFSWGLVYTHTFIKYGFEPSKLFIKYAPEQIEKVQAFSSSEDYASYGAFINAKIGFKYAYFLPSLSVYYQNYGTYNIFGLQSESFKGMTFIPSLGLQVNIGYGKNGKRR